MNDRSWMYRVSLEGLRRTNYFNGVKSFIKYSLSNQKNISGCGIRCPYKICKNRKFLDPEVFTMYLL
jgi:hypothetical protein